MSVPKKKISKRRTRARRSHHGVTKPAVTTCQKCGQNVRPHYACSACGNYRGRNVLNKQAKVEKKLDTATPVAEKKATPKAKATKTKKATPKVAKKQEKK